MTQPMTQPTASLATSDAGTTHVLSPAGIRLVAGLVGPFLTLDGQTEVSTRWGAPVDALFAEAVKLTKTTTGQQVFRAAVGAWTRNHAMPEEAALRLGDLLSALPDNTRDAQRLLDAWANENTGGMIPTFPVQVNPDTRAVLASAVAIEDRWARKAQETHLRFGGSTSMRPGLSAQATEDEVATTAARDAVRVTRRLSSGLVMNFALSDHGPAAAAALLVSDHQTGGVFTEHPRIGDRFVDTTKTHAPTTDVEVVLPEYTIRSKWNLAHDPARWGLTAAMAPDGVPGLGNLEISEARQDAFIEVTHTGVRAAAVTAMTFRAGNMPMLPQFEQRRIVFAEPFAYEIRASNYPEALFTGIYAG